MDPVGESFLEYMSPPAGHSTPHGSYDDHQANVTSSDWNTSTSASTSESWWNTSGTETSLWNTSAADSWWNTSVTEPAEAHPACDAELFKFTLYVCVMGVICTVGICGNIVSFVVLRKDGSSPVASFQLQALSVADNFLLIFWTNHFILGYLFRYTGRSWVDLPHWFWYIRVYSYPILFVAQTETIWLTVMIAVNRYIVVWMPLRARLLCTAGRVRMQVIAVTIFSVVYNAPRFFELGVQDEYVKSGDAETNVTTNATSLVRASTIVRFTELGMNELYSFYYGDILYQIVTFALPLALLAFCNTRIMFAYYAAFKRRQRMVGSTVTRHEHNENNLTLLMIVVVLIFMVCQAPARVVQQVWGYDTKACSPENYIHHFSSTLEAINSSVNFVVYFTFRKRFRRILQWSCCCCCRGQLTTSGPGGRSSHRYGSVISRGNSRVSNYNNHHTTACTHTVSTALEDEEGLDADGETTMLRQTHV